jgi:hypothetical protein
MPTSVIDAIFFGARARFADHRGRPAKLLGATPLGLNTDPETAHAVREARAAVRRGLGARDWGCLGMAIAYFGLGVVLVLRNSVSAAELPKILAVWAAVILLPAAFIWSATRVRGSRRIAAELLAKGYCPQCGYRIHGIRPDHDGCAVCPECSAAWRPARAAS